MTPISNRPASTHTTTANGRNPGTRTGRPAAAVATIEVPNTDANQLGPTAASASRRSSRAARKRRPGERPSVGRRTAVGGGSEVAVMGRASAARPAPDHPGSIRLWLAASPTLAHLAPVGWWRIARTPLDQSRRGAVRTRRRWNRARGRGPCRNSSDSPVSADIGTPSAVFLSQRPADGRSRPATTALVTRRIGSACGGLSRHPARGNVYHHRRSTLPWPAFQDLPQRIPKWTRALSSEYRERPVTRV